MSLKKGDKARLIQPTVSGEVTDRRINDHDQMELCLTWVDADGATHSRWFPADQLEAVEAA